MKHAMTQERFEQLIAAYGADPLRWPEAERAAAQHFLAEPSTEPSGTLQQQLNAAEALDDLLRQASYPGPSEDLLRRLQRQARPSLQSRILRLFDWQGSLWQPAGALAVALFFGLMLGFSNLETVADFAVLTSPESTAGSITVEPEFDPMGEDVL